MRRRVRPSESLDALAPPGRHFPRGWFGATARPSFEGDGHRGRIVRRCSTLVLVGSTRKKERHGPHDHTPFVHGRRCRRHPDGARAVAGGRSDHRGLSRRQRQLDRPAQRTQAPGCARAALDLRSRRVPRRRSQRVHAARRRGQRGDANDSVRGQGRRRQGSERGQRVDGRSAARRQTGRNGPLDRSRRAHVHVRDPRPTEDRKAFRDQRGRERAARAHHVRRAGSRGGADANARAAGANVRTASAFAADASGRASGANGPAARHCAAAGSDATAVRVAAERSRVELRTAEDRCSRRRRRRCRRCSAACPATCSTRGCGGCSTS
jgi:hypothetical protein